MEKNNQYLGTEPLGKLLFKLAVPSVVAQIINMLYNIVDRIYIGHMPEGGSLALTGLGVCMPIIMVVSAFAALVSMGGAPRASIAMGRGDNSAAERILGNCFILQIIISAILTSALLIWDRDLLLAFGAEPGYHRLCRRVHGHIRPRDDIRAAHPRHERIHNRPGLFQDRHVHRADRCCIQYNP